MVGGKIEEGEQAWQAAVPGLFPELAVHGIARVFVRRNAALGKLPRVLPDTARPHDLSGAVTEYYADVCAIPVCIYHFVARG